MGVAIITGAARGIGAATARLMAAEGWQLVLVDRADDDPALDYALATPDELDALAAATAGVAVVGDVRSADDMTRAVAVAIEQFGALDAAVADAGALVGGPPLWEVGDEQWNAMVDINLGGVRNLVRATIPTMLAQPEPRRGRFVAVSSAAALKATPRLGAYGAAKAGVLGLVRSLAADLANTGITANAVVPGTTDTAILAPSAAAYELDGPQAFLDHHIDERLLAPEEVAEVIAWLCSPASSAITGAFIPADAGMTAR